MTESWLTGRRIRVHGLLLAVCLWTVYSIDMYTPGLRDRNGLIKGTDFLHFYTLGNIALQKRGDLLYDMQAQSALLQNLVPAAAGNVYVPLYGPQVSLLFAPFARTSYPAALTVWLLLNAVIYGTCCYLVWKHCPNLRARPWIVLIAALAFPGFFYLILWGQTSGLVLLCFTLAFLALNQNRPYLAGLAIGSLILKPQLGMAAAVIFLFAREWKVVAGAILAALAQLSIGWLYYGIPVMREYLRALMNVRDVLPMLEPRPSQMHSLRAFWSLLIPWPPLAFILYAATAVAVLAVAARSWRSKTSLGLRYSALMLATVLVAPHLTVYDLLILAPALLLLADWTVGTIPAGSAAIMPGLIYLCYPLFLLGSLARVTHLQLSVIAMTGLLFLIDRDRNAPRNAYIA
ncbi:MAG TPA: glycosyltransferase family 87 protein [Terriglobales bacterium]|nr:glycosyltransferase family 87 protein [Terriglobales bacterium]